MSKISAVVLTKNVERQIESCLKNLDFVDEIIVVDDSEDHTPEIVSKIPKVKLFKRKFDNYASQRNFGIEKTSFDWILMLDSDEKVNEDFAKEISSKTENTTITAFKVRRKNIIFGKWIQHTGWYPDYQVRLFKKGCGQYQRLVHEKLEIQGSIEELKSHIIHDNYQTITQYLDKLQKYTTLESEELVSDGYSFNWKDVLLKPNSEILRRYFVEEGYKDGLHGLVLSLLQGFYTLITYLKVWETEKFYPKDSIAAETEEIVTKINKEWSYWFLKSLPHNLFKRISKKITNKIS